MSLLKNITQAINEAKIAEAMAVVARGGVNVENYDEVIKLVRPFDKIEVPASAVADAVKNNPEELLANLDNRQVKVSDKQIKDAAIEIAKKDPNKETAKEHEMLIDNLSVGEVMKLLGDTKTWFYKQVYAYKNVKPLNLHEIIKNYLEQEFKGIKIWYLGTFQKDELRIDFKGDFTTKQITDALYKVDLNNISKKTNFTVLDIAKSLRNYAKITIAKHGFKTKINGKDFEVKEVNGKYFYRSGDRWLPVKAIEVSKDTLEPSIKEIQQEYLIQKTKLSKIADTLQGANKIKEIYFNHFKEKANSVNDAIEGVSKVNAVKKLKGEPLLY